MAIATIFIKLPEDGEKQDKGANTDPITWKVVQMMQDPSKFKIVDDSNPPINVAHLFNSQDTAQQFIDHHLWIKNNPCPPGQVHNMETGVCMVDTERNTAGRDKFNVIKIYPTKSGGQEYYLPDNVDSDRWDNEFYHQNLNRIRRIGGKKTRSNDMHFKKSIRDVESTGYFKFVNGMDDVDVKLRGGTHDEDDGDKSARCYIFRLNRLMFGKEFPHDGGKGYSFHDLKTKFGETGRLYTSEERAKFDLDFNSLKGKWIGFKGITINEGNNKVRCEMYIDTEGIDSSGNFDPNRQNWRKWYSILDEDGRFGKDTDDHKTSKAWTENQIKSTIQFRLDAETGNTNMKLSQSDFKFLSAREISVP